MSGAFLNDRRGTSTSETSFIRFTVQVCGLEGNVLIIHGPSGCFTDSQINNVNNLTERCVGVISWWAGGCVSE